MPRRDWKMSASCINAYKACPQRFRLGYVEGLRLVEDSEAQRVGTNWHKCLEIAELRPESVCPCICEGHPPNLCDCPICNGTGRAVGDPLDRVTAWLNAAYEHVPASIEPTAWAVERAILAYSVAGWLWYYGNDEITTVATEIPFELPLRNPASGRALPHVCRLGKIDRLGRRGDGRPFLVEYKSTSKAIDSGSTYWARLNLDTQINTYLQAIRELQLLGALDSRGIGATDPLISEVLYDVWKRPGIRPRKLTQADSKEFAESGEYCGQMFEADLRLGGFDKRVIVDGMEAEVEPGKKPGTFALRETPDMFGARLLQSIYEEPEKHFARKLVVRTDAELRAAQVEMCHIYWAMRRMHRDDLWWINENQCEATFKCPYIPICYQKLDVYDGETTPPGFRRIFDINTDVTEKE